MSPAPPATQTRDHFEHVVAGLANSSTLKFCVKRELLLMAGVFAARTGKAPKPASEGKVGKAGKVPKAATPMSALLSAASRPGASRVRPPLPTWVQTRHCKSVLDFLFTVAPRAFLSPSGTPLHPMHRQESEQVVSWPCIPALVT